MNFDAEKFKASLVERLKRQYGKDIAHANSHDLYDAVAACTREMITSNWMATRAEYEKNPVKQLYYFSAEFLMGRALSNNLINLKIKDAVKEVLNGMNIDYNLVEDQEPDAGLGNGGLGRLASCFLDSLATLDYPGHGYGIRYEYGMFEQHIEDGYQVEYPDNWLRHRDPWEIKRSDLAVTVKFGGNIAYGTTPDGQPRFYLENAEEVIATPYDMPIIGYDTNTVNTLRLWEATSPNGFDLQLFNSMDYNRAVEKQNSAENISRVLYPNDNGPSGKALRLKQQYFFSSASLQDLVHHFVANFGPDFKKFPDYHVIQLNDTHPVVAIPELMRILIDEYGIGWDEAWSIVQKTFAYTNHTILAEALEKWPIEIFQGLLPRIYQIVEEINRRFIEDLRQKYPDDYEKHNRMSIIGGGKVRMAWLAIHAAFSVNGVAALHTELLKTQELKDWSALYPEKFNNKTNGVTQRRWLLNANPALAEFITKRIGHGWEKDLTKLKGLEKFIDDEETLNELITIKQDNKQALADYLKHKQNDFLDPDSIYDVQVKRLHEYKRQFLNVLHIMYLYNRLVEDPNFDPPARTFIFGAKAASGYRRAKAIIKLINTVADRVNNDRRVRGKLRVVFVENYCVTAAEKIYPAADVSEQISTAGYEASGTSNMKFMINGALTLGTMDGANIEIFEEAGKENGFIFGLSSDQIIKMEADHSYKPSEYLARNPQLAKVVEQLVDGTYDPTHQIFKELHDSLVYGVEGQRPDVFYVLADFNSYCKAQEEIAAQYKDKKGWARKTLINIANSGKFSSDRTIEDYVRDIWKLNKLVVK
ncbi:MAG: glycogen/starch/alpha-glucan phosphorylase [Treponema sp.]|uniref:glycogen/starch/alpha-glucan phosphorylase n=1 Tax=Treponema sp. TaxID=166 RepID=UPI001D52EA35|nr:glycogen/starch/alpha-glucan phosphorylase [Treponema sp.]MBS7310680.1 glycogen/starch/alpha-glucan phosphorylase [Treponema sp.]MCI5696326.1 glycogen/starch/alpha-glucan phosphorylase [Spirochaetia bacterium]MDD5812428.1 glycogen/starch/alpha-glucan phosphorylase [Treponema sp.]MDY5885172.1 glycogen/starch/alpha-glucan phosphorylase [Treponema sp.]